MIEATFTPGTEELFSEGTYRYKILAGGRGCIHGDAELTTPGGKVRIRDFTGGLVLAMTTSGPEFVAAGPAVVFYPEMLLRVDLSDGSSYRVTENHRFLSPSGWRPAWSLSVGCSLLRPAGLPPCPQARCYGADQSEWRGDVRRSIQKVLGFLWCCSEDLRRRDESLERAEEKHRDVARRLACGLPRSYHTWMHKGGRGIVDRRDLRKSLRLLSIQFALLAKEGTSYEDAGSCSAEESFELLLVSSLAVQLSRANKDPLELAQPLAELVLCYGTEGQSEARSLPWLCDMLQRSVGDTFASDDLHLYCARNHLCAETKIVAITPTVKEEFFDIFVPLFNNYIVEGAIHHNSGKSWGVARSLLIRGAQKKMRWLCCRELQNSIAESVHKLFSDQIELLGLSGFYTIQRDGIYGANGSEFFYAGLRNDPQRVKSTEGLDGAWIEEGQSISDESWEVLDPTVRKSGSEIIVTYNPRYDTDPVHKMFFDPATRPPRTWYKTLNYTDNPWVSSENIAQAEHMKRVNPLMYESVWLGKCVPSLSTALWSWDSINNYRCKVGEEPDFNRVVVSVDPAVTANKKSDETGIVVVGATSGRVRHYYPLADLSGKHLPEQWARTALRAYDTYEADAIVYETNQGGLMVEETIIGVCRTDGRTVPRLIPVRATKGKNVRAEPIAALYSQGIVHHAGNLAELERQLLHFNPQDDARQKSPDRMDALVWAITELSKGRVPMNLSESIVAKLLGKR